MLHELLLALNGYPGSILVKKPNGDIQVVEDLPFVHPTESAILNRICQLATHYDTLTTFIHHYGHSPAAKCEVDDMHGLYLQALCHGLNGILAPYRSTLVDLEKQLLADQHLTLAHVQTTLEEYQILFPALTALLAEIQMHQVHGAHVLEKLHKASASGITFVKHAIQKLQFSCHAVFFHQLSLWLLNGRLSDRYSEFFIQKRSVLTGTDRHMVTDEDEMVSGSRGLRAQQQIPFNQAPAAPTSLEQYSLRADMLPSYIPSRLADKILFIGESVQMFTMDKSQSRGSIMRKVEDKFAKDLKILASKPTFDLAEFEAVIDRIRLHVAEQLWRLIVEESDLMNQLQVMKDFFLLGRGELFLAFIDQAQNLLKGPPTLTTEHDVNMAFQLAARRVLLEDENLMQRFRLSLPNQSASDAEGSASSGWSQLCLQCTVQWPLFILFTPSVLTRYNTIFQFLLYVKRIQQELLVCWKKQMHSKDTPSGDTKWWLRNHMAFLVDNLQYYLQVDVIESQFSILSEQIASVKDFEAIRLAHDRFLTALLTHSFLLMKPINHCLHEILGLCHSYSQLMIQSGNLFTEDDSKQLADIAKAFQRQSSLLFTMLSGFRSQQSSPHLAQLLLRVDFNKYFTTVVNVPSQLS